MTTQPLDRLAQRIHDEVYKRLNDNSIAIFLCGAGSESTGSVRAKIEQALTGLRSWDQYRYDIFYPEDLFDELLSGPEHHDLISLENILADSVDAVVIAIES